MAIVSVMPDGQLPGNQGKVTAQWMLQGNRSKLGAE